MGLARRDEGTRAARAEAARAEKQRRREEEARRRQQGKSLAARIQENERQAGRRVASQRAARRAARTVQAAIGFEQIFDDGVAMVEQGLWAAAIKIPDVNFRETRPEERRRVWDGLCELWNGLQADTCAQLIVMNHVVDADGRLGSMSLPHTGRALEDGLVDEYNSMLAAQLARSGRTEIITERYLVVSKPCPDHDAAVSSLASTLHTLRTRLERIGCKATQLTGDEYLALVGRMLRPDEELAYRVAPLDAADVSTKDAVSPLFFDFAPDGPRGKNDAYCLGASPAKLGDGSVSNRMWYTSLVIREPWPAVYGDEVITSLASLPYPMVISLQVHPYEQGAAVEVVRKKLAFIKAEQAGEQRRAARVGMDPVDAQSLSLTENLSEGSDFLAALTDRDEHLFAVSVVITLWARERADLEDAAFRVAQAAREKVFALGVPQYQLRDALNSTLPFANDYMRTARHLVTTELATLQPFLTQEVSDQGGTYVGNNSLSGNMIMLSRRRLDAPMGWILGQPGSGKSFAAKQEMFSTAIANPDHDIAIVDPKGEYVWVTTMLGGQVVDLAADSADHVNLFDLSADMRAGASDPVIMKSEFVTSTLCALLGEESLTPKMKSVIDKHVIAAYDYMRKRAGVGAAPETPTLTLFWDMLRRSDDPVARDLAEQLERYVTGSLRTFAWPTNVNLSSRIIDFNMKRLSGDLRLFGQLVSLDAIWQRTVANQGAGKRTWVYVDEAQNFFKSPAALEYFTKFWAEGRAYGMIPTGITQNLDRVLLHDEPRQMFSNSQYVQVLRQSPNDLSVLGELYDLSDDQRKHVLNARPGEGLLIAADVVIPFSNEFPKGTELYRIFDTDPNSAEERRRARLGRAGR